MVLKRAAPQLPEVEELLTTLESFQNGEFGHLRLDLTQLIGHSQRVNVGDSLEEVHEKLDAEKIDFIAVFENDALLGICSKSGIGAALGDQYKSQSPSSSPIRELLQTDLLQVSQTESIVQVLTRAFNRGEESFYDDIVLKTAEGNYVGLIPVRSLLILQNWVFMENIQQLKQQKDTLNLQKQEMQQNMSLARQFQQALFPRRFPSFPSHLPQEQSMLKFYHTHFNPDILGGDFFHLVYLSDYKAGLFMCDVLGHDVSSALVTAMMRALVASYRSVADNPGELLTQLNRKVVEMLIDYPETMYATVNYLVVDVGKAQFEYASAGHPPPIRLNSKKGICHQLDISCQRNGPPLGILEDFSYETCGGPIEKDDLFLTYTDGLFEVFDQKNQQYGITRLVENISRHLKKPPKQLFNDVITEVKQFAENRSFTDDVCLVGVEVAELAKPGQ